MTFVLHQVGTHSELVALKGIYWELLRRQESGIEEHDYDMSPGSTDLGDTGELCPPFPPSSRLFLARNSVFAGTFSTWQGSNRASSTLHEKRQSFFIAWILKGRPTSPYKIRRAVDMSGVDIGYAGGIGDPALVIGHSGKQGNSRVDQSVVTMPPGNEMASFGWCILPDLSAVDGWPLLPAPSPS